MKTIHYLYALICIFLLIILFLFFTGPPSNVTGQPHPDFETMLSGGDSLSTTSTTHILGYLFGLCTVMTLCVFLIQGAIRKNSLEAIRPWLLFSSLVYIVVYTLTFLSDTNYVATGHTDFFNGWPLPTAWMIFGMWAAPVLFVCIYVFKFRDWILPVEDEERFYDLVAERKKRQNK